MGPPGGLRGASTRVVWCSPSICIKAEVVLGWGKCVFSEKGTLIRSGWLLGGGDLNGAREYISGTGSCFWLSLTTELGGFAF